MVWPLLAGLLGSLAAGGATAGAATAAGGAATGAGAGAAGAAGGAGAGGIQGLLGMLGGGGQGGGQGGGGAISGLLNGSKVATGFNPGDYVDMSQPGGNQALDLFNGMLQQTGGPPPQQQQRQPMPQQAPQAPQAPPMAPQLAQAAPQQASNDLQRMQALNNAETLSTPQQEGDGVKPWEAILMAPNKLPPQIAAHGQMKPLPQQRNDLGSLLKSIPKAQSGGRRQIQRRQPRNSHLRGLLGG